MKVHQSLENLPFIKKPVLTLGTFDGVHLGHQSILNHLMATARQIGGESVVFTFHPHPRVALNPDDHGLELIQTIEERIEKLEKMGVDHLILFPFTREFSRLSATEFVRNILVNQLHIHTLTIGYNHHFGRNREGSIELLRELAPVYGFFVDEIPAVTESLTSVSSTKIREAISTGNIKEANLFLGSTYHFKGTVVQGDRIGTKIGFPTANVKTPSIQLIPKSGVFAVKVKHHNKVYHGMMNIGNRPTVSAGGERRVEIHIFNFSETIYGDELVVYLIDRVREEKNFASLEALTEQLKHDETHCRHILEQYSDLVI
ncbi:MAG: bifunctional riboflavin kinase/FAD synthetase [Bacteroidetes bacterium]|nr:bifunctional riboflavin kinase/FAD synthetase [Bacteroidota bacterium]